MERLPESQTTENEAGERKFCTLLEGIRKCDCVECSIDCRCQRKRNQKKAKKRKAAGMRFCTLSNEHLDDAGLLQGEAVCPYCGWETGLVTCTQWWSAWTCCSCRKEYQHPRHRLCYGKGECDCVECNPDCRCQRKSK